MSRHEGPFLQVVRGDPTPEEIAALIAVLTARARRAATARDRAAAEQDSTARRRDSAWADRSRGLRTPLPHGPRAWRTSAFPR